MRGSLWPQNSTSDSSTSNSLHLPRRNSPLQSIAQNRNCKNRCGNVFQLLTRREVSPRTKCSSKKFWGEKSKCCAHSYELKIQVARDLRRGLISWVEAESLRHFSAKYCPLLPPPRSTIAEAFCPNGKTLASTQFLNPIDKEEVFQQMLCCDKSSSENQNSIGEPTEHLLRRRKAKTPGKIHVCLLHQESKDMMPSLTRQKMSRVISSYIVRLTILFSGCLWTFKQTKQFASRCYDC